VLVNVWDAMSARVVASAPGCRALATASHAVAESHGYPDGEKVPIESVVATCAAVVDAAGDLPVTADLEAGYGDVRSTVAAALSVGVVGCNLEDRCSPRPSAVARVSEALEAGDQEGVPVVVNARTDVFLRASDHGAVLDEAISRGRAYLEAGAACFFAIGVSDPEIIRTLVAEVGAVSVFASVRSPSLDELQALGVQRVSFGPGPAGLAMAALARGAEQLLAHAPYPSDLPFRPPSP
jgi:2-methylisocitrate lyase-like PEP mutase family enzyme